MTLELTDKQVEILKALLQMDLERLREDDEDTSDEFIELEELYGKVNPEYWA